MQEERTKSTRIFLVFQLLTAGWLAFGPVFPQAPPPNPRSTFLISRPKKSTLAGNRPAKPTGNAPIGLGCTLFKADEANPPIRVDFSKPFVSGDRVRFVLEPNINGFLYLFSAENNQTPELVFPHVQYAGGENQVAAHVPFEFPASDNPNPRLQWLKFSGAPATESVYLVLSRQPLPGIPTGAQLKKEALRSPQWSPDKATWQTLQAGANRSLLKATPVGFGLRQTGKEQEITRRRLGFEEEDPEPSTIFLAASATVPMIVVKIDLVHQADH